MDFSSSSLATRVQHEKNPTALGADWREGKSVLQHFQKKNRTLNRKGWETHLCLGCRNRLFCPIPCCWRHTMRFANYFPHFPVACSMTLKFWLFTRLLIRSRSHKMTFILINSSSRLHLEGIKYSTNLSPKLILQYKFVTRKRVRIYIYLGQKDPSHPSPLTCGVCTVYHVQIETYARNKTGLQFQDQRMLCEQMHFQFSITVCAR